MRCGSIHFLSLHSIHAGGDDSDPVGPRDKRSKRQRCLVGRPDEGIGPETQQPATGGRAQSHCHPGLIFCHFLNTKFNSFKTNYLYESGQMEARESEWAAERLAFQEKERVSKQMIFNLQQDNYRLRKSRIVSY